MPFKDIDIFIRAAEAILQGNNPYAIPNLEVFYPLPFYFLFIPFVALPTDTVHVIWSLVQAIIFLTILRKRAIYAVLSMPVLLTLMLGQVDIVVLGLFAALRSGIGAGVALAFLALKPQLVLLLAPWMVWHWWRDDRRQLACFFAVIGTIVILSFAVEPDWLVSFLARSGERTRASISSSLWGLLAFLPSSVWLPVSALAVAVLVVWAWRKNNFDLVATVGLLTSPYIFSYNLMPLLALIRKPWFLFGFTVLSWIAFAISAWAINDRAAALLTIGTLIILVQQR